MEALAYAIRTEGLRKSFPSRRRGERVLAVDGIELAIPPGETFGLVGPDGSGKTTTIRLLNGLLLPDSGRAWVCGYDVQRQGLEVHQRAGYMAQQFSLYGDLSVSENIGFYASIYGVRGEARRERIAHLLEFARLNTFRSRPAGHLSGGMKKKLALACMLLHEPEVVFLDEPTTGVDPVSRREFWDLLASLRLERNLTILVSTPYMDEAERCHRVGLMYGGRLIECGTPAEIKGLVEGQLLELRPADWRLARSLLRTLAGVAEVQTYGERLHVFVDDAARRGPELVQALAAQGVACPPPRAMAPRLEEAFIALIRRRRREGRL
jgi:ABC-2 type transport system ATP-binding protein